MIQSDGDDHRGLIATISIANFRSSLYHTLRTNSNKKHAAKKNNLTFEFPVHIFEVSIGGTHGF